jgi:glycosyltransferase involved in cell wall biosynthesis
MITIRGLRWGDKRLRVLHAPSVVGGNATTLSRTLNQIGIPSISVAYEDHRFSYRPDVVLWKSGQGIVRREMKRISSVFRAALGYEVIHFNFGTTMAMPSLPLSQSGASLSLRLVRELHFLLSELLQILEVRLLILLRRRVVITFQGDDARQGDISREIFDESIALHVQSDYYNSRTDRIKRRRIRRLSHLTNSIYYVNPDLAHFLPATARFIPYCHIDVDGKTPSTKNRKTNNVHIVHAPSHQAAKGTDVIVEILKKMKDDGYPIDFTLIEDIPHNELGDFLLGADLLIDQLHAGWYGGIAVEALCRGVPVMTFLRHADFEAIPEQMAEELPILPVNSADLSEALSRFLALENRVLNELQSCGIRYAAKWHNPKKVAAEYAQHYFSRI